MRTSLFVSGCRIGCPFCFNREAWDFKAGKPFTQDTIDEIIHSLEPSYIAGLTILGGEPMEPENQEGIIELLRSFRAHFKNSKDLWIYSGHTWEEIYSGPWHLDYTDEILRASDVLVDGRFVQELFDIRLRFRGSSNQRIIDIQKSLELGEPILCERHMEPRPH